MCEHLDFSATCAVHRLEDTQDGESLRCMVELHVSCAQCQTPLLFALPLGLSLVRGATMSVDGTEARLTARIGIPTEPRGPQKFLLLPPVSSEGGVL
jgi:invasion protein IalB